MYYAIRHITRYRYSAPIRENVMEVRMQPRSEGPQHCFEFNLAVTPRAQVTLFHDYLGNTIHHFDIPAQHTQLTLRAEAMVEIQPFAPLPECLPLQTWEELDQLARDNHYWDMLEPSRFAHPSPLLNELAGELGFTRQSDPLTVLVALNQAIYNTFDYAPQTTTVDSLIDEAIAARRGVCQDFTHIMIALVRRSGIPCRYVSGYLYHQREAQDRSAEDATHAWLEAYLPPLGWVGFDPTNNLIAAERHIRVAIGRDYADVPPTRGIFKGEAEDELSVGVRVSLADAPAEPDETMLPQTDWTIPLEPEDMVQWQQQQ
jgi:transglutaminase-like putative cysteine protease